MAISAKFEVQYVWSRQRLLPSEESIDEFGLYVREDHPRWKDVGAVFR